MNWSFGGTPSFTRFYCEQDNKRARFPIKSDLAEWLLDTGRAFQVLAQEGLVIIRLKEGVLP